MKATFQYFSPLENVIFTTLFTDAVKFMETGRVTHAIELESPSLLIPQHDMWPRSEQAAVDYFKHFPKGEPHKHHSTQMIPGFNW
jgi:hypothetical protein